MRDLPPFTLKTFTPLPEALPLDEIAYDPWRTQTTLSLSRPGGVTGIAVGQAEMPVAGSQGMARGWPALPRPVFVRDLAHCELWAGGVLLGDGRAVELDSTGTYTTGFRIEGYAIQALTDQPFRPVTNLEDTTHYTAGALLRQALADACPLIHPPRLSDFIDTGILHQYSEVTGKTAGQLAQQFGTEGDGTSLYDALVFPGRRFAFVARVAPDEPDYLEDVDNGVVVQRTSTDLVGTVYVRYTDAISGTANKLAGPFTDPTFSGRNGGLVRIREVNGGTMSQNGAEAFGATLLAKYSQPVYRIQVTRDLWRGLKLPSGGFAPPWTVGIDQWTQIGDDAPLLPVIRIDVNCSTGSAVYQLGDPPLGSLEMTRNFLKMHRAAQLGVNINSWA